MRAATALRTEAAISLVDFLMSYGGDEEAALMELLGYIADRGNINKFCEERGMRVGMLHAWINRYPARLRRYEAAIEARRQLDKEAVRDRLQQVMESTPEGAPRWSDVIKASELMGKNSDYLKDGHGEKDSASEAELLAQLKDLIERNPDMKNVLTFENGVEVVDTTIVSEAVNGTENTDVHAAQVVDESSTCQAVPRREVSAAKKKGRPRKAKTLEEEILGD